MTAPVRLVGEPVWLEPAVIAATRNQLLTALDILERKGRTTDEALRKGSGLPYPILIRLLMILEGNDLIYFERRSLVVKPGHSLTGIRMLLTAA